MGIGAKELVLLDELLDFSEAKKDSAFLELGNNYIKGTDAFDFLKSKQIEVILGGDQHPHGMVSKRLWNSLGYSHVSIDLNGLDDAYKIDLREVIDNSTWFNKFDIIYDGGTGEHVGHQYNLFLNMHRLVKQNGYIIRILPEVGSFPNHCSYYYTEDTFKVLCDKMGYELVKLKRHHTGKDGKNVMVYAVYKKVIDAEFMSEESFKEVPIHYTGTKANDARLYSYLYEG